MAKRTTTLVRVMMCCVALTFTPRASAQATKAPPKSTPSKPAPKVDASTTGNSVPGGASLGALLKMSDQLDRAEQQDEFDKAMAKAEGCIHAQNFACAEEQLAAARKAAAGPDQTTRITVANQSLANEKHKAVQAGIRAENERQVALAQERRWAEQQRLEEDERRARREWEEEEDERRARREREDEEQERVARKHQDDQDSRERTQQMIAGLAGLAATVSRAQNNLALARQGVIPNDYGGAALNPIIQNAQIAQQQARQRQEQQRADENRRARQAAEGERQRQRERAEQKDRERDAKIAAEERHAAEVRERERAARRALQEAQAKADQEARQRAARVEREHGEAMKKRMEQIYGGETSGKTHSIHVVPKPSTQPSVQQPAPVQPVQQHESRPSPNMTTWTQELWGASDIWIRNDTKWPILVTELVAYDCVNTMLCGRLLTNFIMQPGESRGVYTMLSGLEKGRMSFRYNYGTRYADGR